MHVLVAHEVTVYIKNTEKKIWTVSRVWLDSGTHNIAISAREITWSIERNVTVQMEMAPEAERFPNGVTPRAWSEEPLFEKTASFRIWIWIFTERELDCSWCGFPLKASVPRRVPRERARVQIESDLTPPLDSFLLITSGTSIIVMETFRFCFFLFECCLYVACWAT